MDASVPVLRDRPPQTSARHWASRVAGKFKVVEERGNASGWTSEQGKLSGVGGGGITGPSRGWKVGCHPVPHPHLFFANAWTMWSFRTFFGLPQWPCP